MPTTPKRALSAGAFATLLLIALMMGANHVAAVSYTHLTLPTNREV